MSEENRRGKEMGDDAVDAKAITEKVLRRDQRRVWMLGVLCVLAWMAVVMLPWATILPMMARVVRHQAEAEGTATMPQPDTQQERIELLRIVKTGTIATFLGSVGSMFVAALCTTALVLFSRRATMRQVNARLGEISAQLKVLAERK